MEEPNNLRSELFPDGKPEPDEFIKVIAQLIQDKLEVRERNQEADLPVEICEANTTACS